MSITTIIWSMISSACLTLAIVNMSFRGFRRETWGQHLLALSATAAAVFVICELWMMRATTPSEYGAVLRWSHVPSTVVILCMVGFIRFHLKAGRRWLAWAVCVVRAVGLAANFLVGENASFLSITHLETVSLFGEPAAMAEGVRSPWIFASQGSLLLFAVFAADATVTVLRRGDRRQALPSCGGIALLSLSALVLAVLVAWGLVDWPLTVAPFFLGVVAAMGFGVSREAARAVGLTSELRESEERTALAAEAAEIGVWVWDVAEGRVWGSARWRRMFGFPPDEAIDFGMVVSRIHPDDRERTERGLRHAADDRIEFIDEFRLSPPDGSPRLIVSRCRVLSGVRGKPARMTGVMLDVTERRQSEREISLQRVQLAHLSRVNMLGELTGSLAHELSQPLTAILGNAQAAQRFLEHGEPDVGEVREALADIVAEDVRAGEIIHRLRRLLRKGEVERQPFTVDEAVRESLKLVRSDLESRGFTARTELAPDLPMLQGDRVQFLQVLLNLVLNACDAMAAAENGGRQLTIRTGLTGDASILVSVIDTGTGIAPDMLERVFEPFYTTKRNGLGLGLTVCRSLVEAHGGRLWATNNPEGGATFHLAHPSAGQGARTAVSEIRDAGSTNPPGGTARS